MPERTMAADSDEPFRAELLSVDRLAERAREVAREQQIPTKRRPRVSPLRPLVQRAIDQLPGFNAAIAVGAREGKAVSPAMEWLLDNYYLVEEQAREAARDLPPSYDAELPRLAGGPLAGFPRVFELAVTLLEHTDSRVEADHLDGFVMAYQEVSPLSMGETWAVPIMLRSGLVENVRRLAHHVVETFDAEQEGEQWADRLLLALEEQRSMPELLDTMEHLDVASTPPFLIRLERRMSDQERDVSAVTSWIERQMRVSGRSMGTLISEEHSRQAADQVSIANAITSLRFINNADWHAFFDRCSLVETILRTDPASVYAVMDFASRDRYRHALESLAKRSPHDEPSLARRIVERASEALRTDVTDLVKGHVGYYLISGGRYDLEVSLGYRPTARDFLYRTVLSRRGFVYWGLLAILTLGLSTALAYSTWHLGTATWGMIVLWLLSLLPLSELALGLVNRTAAALWPPRPLPKLDHTRPVSDTHRTLVVVPSLLTSPDAVRSVLDQLEIHHLANSDENIHFALLGDLRGSASEHDASDVPILEAARDGIDELNTIYGAEASGPFHLFIRSRRFNETEGKWMGWERKRGSLTELVHLLRGAGDTSITLQSGDPSFLPGVAFLITLDADTVLPRDSGAKMICTIAHPLNRAVVDPEHRVVPRGYGLVQPHVGMTLTSAIASAFARLYTGPTGIDPYAGAISDTYQDVFGEGSFTGKGIFEVDVFAVVLEGRFPENRLLSHDLIEGNFLRTGLASDVEVLDDYPSSYLSQCSRYHRWARGDWQLLPWLFPTVTGPGVRYRNPLTLLHRWKILDNLRRSLFPLSMMILGAAGWLIIPNPGPKWAALLLLIIVFDALMHALESFLTFPSGLGFRTAMAPVLSDLKTDLLRSFVALAVLPHQALLMGDAAFRSVWRLFISKRHLLEWTTHAEAESASADDLRSFGRSMGPAAAMAVVLVSPALLFVPSSRVWLIPAALIWLASPLVAWYISLPSRPLVQPPSTTDIRFMRRIARKTWRFFATFVCAEDHWLVPDNFQEDPKGEIAHRTSPTNMGLQLLAELTAHDLGYQPLSTMIDRVSRTLSTMVGLKRFRGHFYNWYDTLTLEPLRPQYVSTVDTGNLAGHLLVLRTGLLSASEAPILAPQVLAGIADSLELALESLLEQKDTLGPKDVVDGLRRDVDELLRRVALADPPRTIGMWHSLLDDLWRAAAPLARSGESLQEGGGHAMAAVLDTVEMLRQHREDLDVYTPWATIISEAPHALAGWVRTYDLAPLLANVPSLVGLAEGLDTVLDALDALEADPAGADEAERSIVSAWASSLSRGIRENRERCAELLARLRLMVDIGGQIWAHTDFLMLYDKDRELFSIGFNTERGQLDDSYYDMLASECRLASYLAVAKDEVPQEHWFRLGRSLTRTAGGYALLSWSASMFEYLMPHLVMRTYPNTLLQATAEIVVKRQIQYGAERGVPWGVSESAFAAKDSNLVYQYQAFGVPGLGLKRGLSDDVVIAPYATLLALHVDRPASISNLRRLSSEGAEGWYGYYESLDYTPGRVPTGQRRDIVRAYMAHHQAMSFVALGNELNGGIMRDRFHAEAVVETAELLLQERLPRHAKTAQPHVEEVEFVRSLRELPPPVIRSYPLADTPIPATHFLSNGRYSVMITNAGGGYSRCADVAVSRYREDITRDCWGQFCFIRDVESGALWSAAYQPSLSPYDDYHCVFSADRAEFRRRDGEIETYTEIVVSPEDDVEVRRISITNHGIYERTLELTSYFEVALAAQADDQAHRTFSNLFVETEAVPGLRTVLFTRRPRSDDQQRLWGLHSLAWDEGHASGLEWETDRARFLGRLRHAWNAQAVHGEAPLSGTEGAVLDPVCSLRCRITLGPGEMVRTAFTTGVTSSREEALRLAEQYSDMRGNQHAMDLAWSTSQIELRDLGISPEQAVVFQRLASRLLVTDPYSRLKIKTQHENTLPLSSLWGLGISGDLPILLVKIERLEDTPGVRQALLAHQYWRAKGFRCDLVILNTKPSAYRTALDDRLQLLVRTGHALQMVDKPGGIFIRRADQISPDVLNLLESVARATIEIDCGPIALQLNQRGLRPEPPDPLILKRTPREYPKPSFTRPELEFDNGYGGFDPESREYVIVLENGDSTPMPWINIIAGPEFGTMISEAGVGCTWARNSHENRLTTWNNDPVSDGSGEILYVRDEETGEFWSPTQLPITDGNPYVVRHGHGYSTFEHTCHGIEHHTTCFVGAEDPMRVVHLRLKNVSDEKRLITVTQFIEWVLGDSRSKANQRVVTRYDTELRTLTAHNYFNEDFPGRVAFLTCDREPCGYTASRTEFLGRNGTPADPAAMHRKGLGQMTGRFHDNCGAVMAPLEIEPGETADVRFLLGQCDTLEEARDLVERYRDPAVADKALTDVKAYWKDILGSITISTPDPALDALINGPLLYQALACRVWARTALYQSSGAFGFRDQLQDILALLIARPDIAREQIVEASRHQFEAGDVQHWWQPVSGRGVRTRFTDDRDWLPFVVATYIEATGDFSVLDESTAYITGPELEPGQDDLYLVPVESKRTATVYEHCVAALEASRGTGPHGLPLIGGGDWNDGMNRIGIGGRGESVWLAWFLILTLRKFAPICELKGDSAKASDYLHWASRTAEVVEREAWDGAWYRRAYFDDGTPLGTRSAEECQIDLIAQAWSVISGGGESGRALRSLQAVEEKLVSWENSLVMLLTPPFDRMPEDPGYIKGYIPGVRENGGQYTHAAVWIAMAYALTGDGDEAAGLLDLINPLNHSMTREAAEQYLVEPYVLAGDVYTARGHVGRGGWTWYTGSASWFYNTAVNTILGISTRWENDQRYLVIDPCIPKAWPSFRAEVRLGSTTYEIRVENPRGVNRGIERTAADGSVVPSARVPIVDDGRTHRVVVTMIGG